MTQVWVGSTDIVYMLRQIGGWHVGSQAAMEAGPAVLHALNERWVTTRIHRAPAFPDGVEAYELTDAGLEQLRKWDARMAGGADQMRNWYRANAKKHVNKSIRAADADA